MDKLIEAGINEEGEMEFIGTDKAWQDHDCHTSPEDGCAACAYLGNVTDGE